MRLGESSSFLRPRLEASPTVILQPGSASTVYVWKRWMSAGVYNTNVRHDAGKRPPVNHAARLCVRDWREIRCSSQWPGHGSLPSSLRCDARVAWSCGTHTSRRFRPHHAVGARACRLPERRHARPPRFDCYVCLLTSRPRGSPCVPRGHGTFILECRPGHLPAPVALPGPLCRTRGVDNPGLWGL